MPGKDPPDSEEQKLRKWLEKEGYALQMKVALLFKCAGFDVSQSENYVDPQAKERKFREIDVVASVSRNYHGLTLSVAFLVECKYAKKAWVIFTSPGRFNRNPHFLRVLGDSPTVSEWQKHSNIRARLLARILESKTLSGIWSRAGAGGRACFSMPESVGYDVVESLSSSGTNNAYQALMQVSSCTQSYDIKADKVFAASIADFEERINASETGQVAPKAYVRIVFPVVVVRGHLYECYLERG